MGRERAGQATRALATPTPICASVRTYNSGGEGERGVEGVAHAAKGAVVADEDVGQGNDGVGRLQHKGAARGRGAGGEREWG